MAPGTPSSRTASEHPDPHLYSPRPRRASTLGPQRYWAILPVGAGFGRCSTGSVESYRQVFERGGSDITSQPDRLHYQCHGSVAVAETKGPETSLALLDGVAEELDGYHLLHAARGSMLHRLGRPDEASQAYDRAAALARSEPEISFRSRRRTHLDATYPEAQDG